MNTYKNKNIEYLFNLDYSFYDLCIENKNFYYDFVKNIIEQDNESNFLYIDNKLEKFKTRSYVISDMFHLEINSKKQLKAFYNKLQLTNVNNDRKEQMNKISELICILINDLSNDMNCDMDYNFNFNLLDILNMIDYKFNIESASFLELLIIYIKSLQEIMTIDIIFILNITAILNDDDIIKLKTEIEFLGITIVNISYSKIELPKIITKIIIDKDLCEIY